MAKLSISLFGPFQASLDGQPLTGFKSNKVRALLAYLAAEAGSPHSRERLAGLLWPEWPDKDALSNLRYALSDLRREIGDRTADPPFLFISRDTLEFNQASSYELDVATFIQLSQNDNSDQAGVECLSRAAALYQGEFLQGFSLGDCPDFEEWIHLTRDRLTRTVSSVLHRLIEFHKEQRDYNQAQAYAWQLVELEPLDETAHSQLMKVLVFGGQRSAALAQYESLSDILKQELGVEPDEKIQRLYQQIRSGDLDTPETTQTSERKRTRSAPSFLDEKPPMRDQTVFVGRKQELRKLEEYLAKTLKGSGQVAFVTGEAGSGKTALLQQFSQLAQQIDPELLVVEGHCNAYTGIGDPYLPFREILDSLTGDVESKWAAGSIDQEHARRLWNALPHAVSAIIETGPELIDTFLPRYSLSDRAAAYHAEKQDWFIEFGNLLDGKPPISFVAAGPLQTDLFEQYTRVLQRLAYTSPLVLLIDDLQWADLGSVSLLFHLGRRLPGSRILVVGAYRPEEVSTQQDTERHPLEPVLNEFSRSFGDNTVNLDEADPRIFLDALINSEPNRLSHSFREMLYHHTRGHPLFTSELLRGLQERGDLIQDQDGFWIEGRSLDWETLPARVEAAIKERVARLPTPLQRILAIASVEGEDFTAEMVAKITGEDERSTVRLLSSELARRHRLISAQAIEHIGTQRLSRYKFKSYLLQKYMYDTMDEAERAYLHEDIGNALEALYTDHTNDFAVPLARHFQEARDHWKAIQYLHLAGDKAVHLSAYQEGLVHLTKALNLLLELPESEARALKELPLQLSLCKAWMGEIPGPEYKTATSRASELCLQLDKTNELSQVLGESVIFHYVGAEYQKALELAEEVLRLAERAEDPLLIMLGHWHLGIIQFSRGEFIAARSHLEEVISRYDPDQHHAEFIKIRGSDAGVSAMAYLALCLWIIGFPEQAFQRDQEAMSLARKLNHSFSLADVLCFGGCVFEKLQENSDSMLQFANELVKVSRKIGVTSFHGTGMCYRGEALATKGQLESGISDLRSGIKAKEERGAIIHLTGIQTGLAKALADSGEIEEGLATLAKVVRRIEETGERYFEAEAYRFRGMMQYAQGHVSSAEADLLHAIKVAQLQSAKSFELRAVIQLAEIWNEQGKTENAYQILKKMYSGFSEGLDTKDMMDAKRLLETIQK